ncbi:HAD family hydrolase [Qipengyuania sp. 6B39]|uniref:HAD family hydrolase n=1 Tax=Qipengyuania proteolytica TaxID=2867239 RepID=UPI001C8A035F|nr:HAD family hydrolase [Qipengyuania proteolytica]
MIQLATKVVVLDLDDTLYLERDFARSGYVAVGRSLAGQVDPDRFAQRCFDVLEEGRRGDIFDIVLAEFGVAVGDSTIADLVEIYREHEPVIEVCADAARFLDRFAGRDTAIITDGPARTQQAKLDALGLSGRIGHCILTGSFGKGQGKPHPRAYEDVAGRFGRAACDHVYIADNAAKDFVTPKAMGWRTIQVMRPGRIHGGQAPTRAHAADHAVIDLDRLIPA